MWQQIVTILVGLVVATYVIQLLLPRSRGGARRSNARWDIAPVMGFCGILLLALSLTEAIRSSTFITWAAGLVAGIVLSGFLWIALGSRESLPVRSRGSALLATFRLIRTFGPPVVAGVVGIYVVVRIIGTTAGVFVSGLAGAGIITMAIWIFMMGRQVKKAD